MEFSAKKLPLEEADRLKRLPVKTVQPYTLMLAPVYVYLRANQKFVAIKEPLDFFTPEDLKRYEKVENFWLTPFVDSVAPFRRAAVSVKGLLELEFPMQKQKPTPEEPYPEIQMPVAPYEVSDAVVRVVGRLWNANAVIEPFFLSVFAEELCESISKESLVQARESSVKTYESALLSSSLAVFFALHVGLNRLETLDRLRRQVFEEMAAGKLLTVVRDEVDEVAHLAKQLLVDPGTKRVLGLTLVERPERAAHRVYHRLKRIQMEMIDPDREPITIFGNGGFTEDV